MLVNDLVVAEQTVLALEQVKFKGKIGYYMGKNVRKIKAELEDFRKGRDPIFEKYAKPLTKDEIDNYPPSLQNQLEPGVLRIAPGSKPWMNFSKEVQPLLDTEIKDLSLQPVQIEAFIEALGYWPPVEWYEKLWFLFDGEISDDFIPSWEQEKEREEDS